MRQNRTNLDTYRYKTYELDPCIAAHTRPTKCSLCKCSHMILFVALIAVALLAVVGLVFVLLQPSKTSESNVEFGSDMEYAHFDMRTPLDYDDQEFEPFGVKMDTMPYSRRKTYQIKPNNQFLQISSNKKESEIGGPMEAFYREQEQLPLSPNHILIEITTGSTAPITKATSRNFAASTNPLTKSRTTTAEPTVILQTTSISPPSEVFKHRLGAEISNIPVSSTVEKDCSVHAEARSGSGIYSVSPDGGESFLVYCDQETAGGGWTVIQRRTGPTVYFYNRTWHEYENGFGDIKGSYWLGLMKIHRLAPRNMDSWTLRIELHGDTCSGQGCVKESDGFWWGEWPFKLGDSSSMYVIELGPVLRGNLTSPNSTDYLMESNGYPFTTIDRDNDAVGLNCAQFRNYGGWWHSNCGHVALNGIYGDTEPSRRYMVYTYSGSKTRNKKYFIHPKKSIMMIRPSS